MFKCSSAGLTSYLCKCSTILDLEVDVANLFAGGISVFVSDSLRMVFDLSSLPQIS